MQGVENARFNRSYFCPTCQVSHPAKLQYGLDICVSSSELHAFHQPREEGVFCPPDSSHVDWLTIPGAKIEDLLFAWRLDYHREPRPMRVLLVAGLNDLIKGGNQESVQREIERFKINVDHQNRYHPDKENSFSVATILNPPKLVWFPDNGPAPPGHHNRLVELAEINGWISDFNQSNCKEAVPRFQTWGVRSSYKVLQDGSKWDFKTHRWNEWRQTEPDDDKLHLADKMRVKMGKSVVKYFEGERERNGPLL